MTKDIHKNEFDFGTKIKLEIFREYLKAWLPTFTKARKIYWRDIYVYDFFSGEGKDSEGNSGSPLIIIEELLSHHEAIESNKLNLTIVLNEKVKRKFNILKEVIDSNKPKEAPYKVELHQRAFKEFFNDQYSRIKSDHCPRLIFLDQYGIKEITKDIFSMLVSLKRTDFIFFISSSFVRRFYEQEEFKNYITLTKSDFDQSRPVHSHRVVFEYYKSLLGKEYHLAPFSIKKGSNIYGLIFGSNHSLGLEKFLNIAWRINPHSGDANFNIDEEGYLTTGQWSLFPTENLPKKLNVFERDLKARILSRELSSDSDVYKYSLDQGFLPRHANVVLKELIINQQIEEIRTTSSNIHRLEPPQKIVIYE
ncbi:three-Cys-motif partner protein TcmP [Roseivirga spongicola]|uniref:GMT-like wHTH domain-containing protein n=1 Tax=Roseivirga spongicola TaxID=333140 RepID=A0A150XFR5_9BACT|nr:three-Cys-motif partner protein TcmP [Roseivirga spongicola]KYG77555.1 hypothetical protein AWW68_01930 [Roseivirga spongicola]WPZ11265.1 three-Cys-motif partner protein TcmP [Roseivirga spongicola]